MFIHFTHQKSFTMTLTKPYDTATRAQALTMLQLKRPVKEITVTTAYNKSTKGSWPHVRNGPKIISAYVEDAPRAGKPKKVIKKVEEMVVKAISEDSTTRQLLPQDIANLVSSLI
jgi:hypothetical protein